MPAMAPLTNMTRDRLAVEADAAIAGEAGIAAAHAQLIAGDGEAVEPDHQRGDDAA